jgi:hypothetical protein
VGRHAAPRRRHTARHGRGGCRRTGRTTAGSRGWPAACRLFLGDLALPASVATSAAATCRPSCPGARHCGRCGSSSGSWTPPSVARPDSSGRGCGAVATARGDTDMLWPMVSWSHAVPVLSAVGGDGFVVGGAFVAVGFGRSGQVSRWKLTAPIVYRAPPKVYPTAARGLRVGNPADRDIGDSSKIAGSEASRRSRGRGASVA